MNPKKLTMQLVPINKNLYSNDQISSIRAYISLHFTCKPIACLFTHD